jgi:hypothetical protein
MKDFLNFLDGRLKGDPSYNRDLVKKALQNALEYVEKFPDYYAQIESALWFSGLVIPKKLQNLYLIKKNGEIDLVEIKKHEQEGVYEIIHLLNPKKPSEKLKAINLAYVAQVPVPGAELIKPGTSIIDSFKKFA